MNPPAPVPPSPRRTLARWAGWFAFGNAFLLLLAGWRYWTMIGWPESFPAQAYLVIAAVGHFLTVAMVAVVPALVAGMPWPCRRIVGSLLIAVGTLVIVGIIVDSIVFSLYRFHLNGMVWSLIVNGHIGEILPLSAGTWTMAGLFVLLALAAQCGLAWASWRWIGAPNRQGRWVALAGVGVVVAGHAFHLWGEAVQHTGITKIPRVLPGYHPLTAKRSLRKLGWLKHDAEPRIRYDAGRSHLKYPLEPLRCAPPTNALNVLFLVIDGWRFDMLNESVTPNLWRFATNSLRFENHSAAANATRFGIFAMHYGLCGTYWHAILGETRGPVLLSQLRQAGYQFGAWGAAPLTSPEFDRTVFAEVRDQITPVVEGKTTPARDQEITRRCVEFLDRRDPRRPFYAFVFYDSTHAYDHPPDAPAPFQPAVERVHHLKLNKDYDPTPVRNRFLNAAHFVDSLVAQILRRLEQDGLLERTVVLVTGDHGQEFNDTGRNYWGHNSNYSRWQTGVPLVVHWPGRSPAVFTHQTSHLDLAPTLLRDLLGCDTPARAYAHGLHLLDTAPRNPLIVGNWDHFAMLTPGRIDVIYESGRLEHFDENYRELATPPPADALKAALEALSRFNAR